MDGIGAVDIFATKGIEYLIVIAFLAALVFYWKLLGPSESDTATVGPRPSGRGWFAAPREYLFHPGHAWAAPEEGDLFRVGMDDFAQQLVGEPTALDLPNPGEQMKQGDLGWTVRVGPRSVRMLSPVDGVVESVNAEVCASPGIVCDDPYEDGWLVKVRVGDPDQPQRNLLSADMARDWLDRAAEGLRAMWTRELGVALPDGGVPIKGFGRAMSDDHWDDLAEELLLSSTLPDQR
jgi:glycine cleavage system H protein